MMTFVKGSSSGSIVFGRTYQRRTALPKGPTTSPGICLGMALAWIRHLHAGGGFEYVPTEFEGALIQFGCYAFPVVRVLGRPPAAPNNSSFLPSDAIRHPILIGYCTRVGFTPIYKGVRAAEGVARLAKECCRSAGLRTFILAGGFHATALAVRGKDIAVYDSAEGIGIFRQRTASDDELMTSWFRTLPGNGLPLIGVLELTY
ncbi:hypothetical protein [Cupriavidus pauculus]|uniref:hypothetical protein n=1 Tax=Cupriavidus pauculus TaxID=82633 RepID=UPI00204063CA|nr:hypothetical protein [Cupriavidus pauculus]MCM3608146.1 hypothetical protein [Cupriavidus pauculus]